MGLRLENTRLRPYLLLICLAFVWGIHWPVAKIGLRDLPPFEAEPHMAWFHWYRPPYVVQLASYAPLFAHIDAWQWNPNLIWFDNLRSMGTPNYYVQTLFSTNRGTTILPIKLAGANEKLFACASRDAQTGQIILKVVNAQPTVRNVRISLAGAKGVQQTGEMQVLAASDLAAVNTLDQPTRVSPVASSVQDLGQEFQRQFPPYSLTVMRISAARD